MEHPRKGFGRSPWRSSEGSGAPRGGPRRGSVSRRRTGCGRPRPARSAAVRTNSRAGGAPQAIDSIPKVDLAILRLAVAEICYAKDIPKVVAVNEAVRIAKKFSDDKSAKFINGILANIGKDYK